MTDAGFLVVLVVVACSLTGIRCDFDLTILHTNDVHAHIEQFELNGGLCTEEKASAGLCYGGVARRQTQIQQIRRRHKNVVLLDAGDQFQGSIWFSYYKGLEANMFMSMLGYDAMCLGNHEFDNGVEGLEPFLDVEFPVLSANIDVSREHRLDSVLPSYALHVGDQRIGVIGYITTDTSFLVPPAGIKTISFTDEIEAVRREAAKLKAEGVNKIIALGHAGFAMDIQVATEVEEVDVVIGGHTNTFLYTGDPPSNEVAEGEYPYIVTQSSGKQVLVVQDYTFGKYLGYLNVTFDDEGNVIDYAGNPILLDSSVEEDSTVLEQVADMRIALDILASQEIGYSAVYLDGEQTSCRLRECNLGNLLTDAVVRHRLPTETSGAYWANYSIAIWNGGSIRAPINQGVVTIEDILTVFPFTNEVEGIRVTGSTLKKILEHSVSKYDPSQRPGAFLQVSGLKVTYDIRRAVGDRVLDVQVRCTECLVPRLEPLKLNGVYDLLTSSFLADGGDGYSVIADEQLQRIMFGDLLSEVLGNHINATSPVWQGLEERIVFVEDEDDTNAAVPSTIISPWWTAILTTTLMTIHQMAMLKS